MATTATALPFGGTVPDHVPPELVHPIGLTMGPEFLAAPHDFMARLHADYPPIFFSPSAMSSAWTVIKYEDAFHVLRNPQVFSTAGNGAFPREGENVFQLIPLEIDPPEHRKYRAMLDPIFSPKAIAAMDDAIRRLANDLIDRIIDRGECEFTAEFGRPLPVSVFLDIMGLPQDMRDTFVTWAMGLLHSGDRETAGQAMRDCCDYLRTVIADKARNPDGGAVSLIVHGQPGGAAMDPREIFGFTFFLFIAGLDTVFAALNNIFVWLAQNPDRRREIIDNPDRIDAVVEELLRVYGVTFSGRTLLQDYEMRGVKMKAGDKLTCILPACNYDPDIFPEPQAVNFHRPRRPILTFTGGVHSCMGAHLARLEVKVALQEWLRRIPDFALKPGTSIDYWPGGVIGPKTVPLVW